MSANEGDTWLGVWAAVRRVAAPVIPLLLGAAAMALLLDSGTVHPPSIGSRSASPPPEKIVVSAPPHNAPAHHRPAAPTTPTAPQASVPAAAGSTASVVPASPTAGSSTSRPSSGAVGKKTSPKPPASTTPATGTPALAPPAPQAATKLPGQALAPLEPTPKLKPKPPGL